MARTKKLNQTLSNAGTRELKAELRKRELRFNALVRRRAKLIEKIAALGAEISQFKSVRK